MAPQFLYRYAQYKRISGILEQPNSDEERILSFSEIFYHRTNGDGTTEEYLSVFSHDPLINETAPTSDERAVLVFPIISTRLNLASNSGIVELPINEICEDVNAYGKQILYYQEHNHPHYGLHYDEKNKHDVDMILLSISELCCVCHPYKEYQIEA